MARKVIKKSGSGRTGEKMPEIVDVIGHIPGITVILSRAATLS